MPQVSELSVLPIAKTAPSVTDYVICEIEGANRVYAAKVPIANLPSGSGGLVIGTSPITGGSSNHLLYNNAGVLGDLPLGVGLAISGGTLVNTGELTIGSSPISGGTTQRILYDNAGVVGELILGTNLTISSGTLNAAGGSPGGVNTNVQFNNSGAFGGDSGFTYAGSGQATLALGTITANAKALNITGTWNASGVVFDAPLFMNITNTASAAGSLLADFQVGSTTVNKIDKLGQMTLTQTNANIFFTGTSNGNGGITFDPSGSQGIAYANSGSSGIMTHTVNSNSILSIGFRNLALSPSTLLIFQTAGNNDVCLAHQGGVGSGQLMFTNAATLTNPVGFFVYNTSDVNTGTPTNYERGVFQWSGNVLFIGTGAGGTGSNRDINVVAASGNTVFGNNSVATNVTYTNNANGALFQINCANNPVPTFTGGSGTAFGFTSGGSVATGTIDTFLTRGGPATLQQGAADAAAPVAQATQVQSVVAGTSNTAGQNWTIQGSRSTGTGAAGNIIFNTGIEGSATAANTVTITIASPAVFTFNGNHQFVPGQPVQFTTTGALPTGLTASTTYYVIAAGLTQTAFEVAATPGGAAINTSGSQSGTHTCTPQTTVQNPASALVTFGPSGLTGSQTTAGVAINQSTNNITAGSNIGALTVNLGIASTGTPNLYTVQNWSINNASAMNLDGEGRLQVNQTPATTPIAGGTGLISVANNATSNFWNLSLLGYNGGGGAMNFTATRGVASPTAHAPVQLGDSIASLYAYPDDGTNYVDSGRFIGMQVDQNFTSGGGHVPTRTVFETASISNHVERLRIDSNGNMVFGFTGSPSAIGGIFTPINNAGSTCTISIASPGVITLASHGFVPGQQVSFSTTGALPTGITAGTAYFVIAAGLTSGAFEIAATPSGAAINTSGSQSGTQTVVPTNASNYASPTVSFGPSGLTGALTTAGTTHTQTWNTTGVVDAGLLVNVTDIASGAGSLLLDVQHNATQIFTVNAGGPSSLAGSVRVYNTTDGNAAPTNYERGVFDWTTNANVLTIGTQKGGTGSARDVVITSQNNIGLAVGGNASVATSNLTINSVGAYLGFNGALGFSSGSNPTTGIDTAIYRVATNVLGVGTTNIGSPLGWYQWVGQTRVTADVTFTSTTTLGTVTGLSVSVQAGRTYAFEAQLFVTDAAAGGVQAAIAGTCTATNIQYTGWTVADNAIKGKANATALATAVGSTTTTETTGIMVQIYGTITVNAAGTLLVQAAQNTSNATATTIKRGSYFYVYDNA